MERDMPLWAEAALEALYYLIGTIGVAALMSLDGSGAGAPCG